jgi:hypothetical protein
MIFTTDCAACPRLAGFLEAGRASHPGYFCRPVPPFGDERPKLLIVGLAPGFHGANRTGRPFTGDHAGILLYETLHAFGYAEPPDLRFRRRRPEADRLPHHQRGQMRAAGEQAGDRRDQALQRLSQGRTG